MIFRFPWILFYYQQIFNEIRDKDLNNKFKVNISAKNAPVMNAF